MNHAVPSVAGNTALLVAGYNVADTTVGKNYKGTSSTSAELVVTA